MLTHSRFNQEQHVNYRMNAVAADNFASETSLDENWLSELAAVVKCLIEGQTPNEKAMSNSVKQALVAICGAFKEEKLNL